LPDGGDRKILIAKGLSIKIFIAKDLGRRFGRWRSRAAVSGVAVGPLRFVGWFDCAPKWGNDLQIVGIFFNLGQLSAVIEIVPFQKRRSVTGCNSAREADASGFLC